MTPARPPKRQKLDAATLLHVAKEYDRIAAAWRSEEKRHAKSRIYETALACAARAQEMEQRARMLRYDAKCAEERGGR